MPTVRLPLMGVPTFRSGSDITKDQHFINCLPESLKNPETETSRYYVVKRPGLVSNLTVAPSSGVCRGLLYWAVNDTTYSVFDNKLYANNTAIQTLSTSTGTVGMVESQGDTNYVIVVDGTDGYRVDSSNVVLKITSSTWTASTAYTLGQVVTPVTSNGYAYQCTVAGTTAATQPTWPTVLGTTVTNGTVTWTCINLVSFPTPHVPQPVFFDGYIFVMGTDGHIYNSDVQNAMAWSASNFLSAEMFPDKSIGIARHLNHLIAFGRKSVEFFYDAANSSGSPLRRTEQAAIQVGTPAFESIAESDGLVMFIAQSAGGGRYVAGIENLKVTPVSTEAVERVLSDEGTGISTAKGFICRVKGHLLYVITLYTQNITLVYDITEKIWSEWRTGTSGRFLGKYQTEKNGKCLILNETGTDILELSQNVYQDLGSDIYTAIQTVLFDGDSYHRKFFSKMTIVGDRLSSTLNVSWSDDDYQTFSTPRPMDLSTRPFLTRLGSSRRRSFKLEHTDNVPLRMEAIELELEKGTH